MGATYAFSIAVDAVQYRMMKKELAYYKGQFMELSTTIQELKTTEAEFKKLFSLKSKEEVLKSLDTSNSGSIDIEVLKDQIKSSIESASEIKAYLSEQRDIYVSTPKGWPTPGRISSNYGTRSDPITGKPQFHTGIDISAPRGTPIFATADGIVAFSRPVANMGNIVVIEHGFGYSTIYAHIKQSNVKPGQRVKQGDVIAFVGSSGRTTGPHLHYEVWKNNCSVNPYNFVVGKMWEANNKTNNRINNTKKSKGIETAKSKTIESNKGGTVYVIERESNT
jgi:murein DD-endopeptidase MepM/ murein hydrolase activator NlpD